MAMRACMYILDYSLFTITPVPQHRRRSMSYCALCLAWALHVSTYVHTDGRIGNWSWRKFPLEKKGTSEVSFIPQCGKWKYGMQGKWNESGFFEENPFEHGLPFIDPPPACLTRLQNLLDSIFSRSSRLQSSVKGIQGYPYPYMFSVCYVCTYLHILDALACKSVTCSITLSCSPIEIQK
jgi:hypothetical protein